MAKKKATLYVEVEFDDAITDADSLSNGLDILMDNAKSTPGILDDFGDPRITGFYVLPYEMRARNEMLFRVHDQGGRTDDQRPLPMLVYILDNGIEVQALDDKGGTMAQIVLDYHGNRLQGLTFTVASDEPENRCVFSDDVDAERKKKH